MKIWKALVLPVVLLVGLGGLADAKSKTANTGTKGKIVSVMGNGTITIVTKGKQGAGKQTVTITTDASTTVEIDGVAGKSVRDLSAGSKVVVQGGSSGPASDIQATSSKHRARHRKI